MLTFNWHLGFRETARAKALPYYCELRFNESYRMYDPGLGPRQFRLLRKGVGT